MSLALYVLLGGVAGLIVGIVFTVVGSRLRGGSSLGRARREAAQILSDSEREAATLLKEAKTAAKEERIELRAQMENEAKEQRKELVALEKRILAKEESIDKRVDALDRKGNDLNAKQRELDQREKLLDRERERIVGLIAEQTEKLEAISGMTAEQARRAIVERLETEVKRDSAQRLKRIEDELTEQAEKKAQWILGQAVQRCAADHVAEATVSVVNLPNDEMKGRIIGREGRNIRALESATGINIIIDDTPEAVILSGFDPVRREVARLSLERLITDGRIHPARIEEIVEKVNQEIAKTIKERGEAACLEADVHGLHAEIVKLLGRLSYRTSYGQNVLKHSIEVAHLAGIMAAELGTNIQEAKRAGLVHDIGKAINHEVEGSHATIGHDFAKRFGETKAICNATAAHHGEVEAESVTAVLVQAGDALSAARPGARSETVETYIKRLEQLEQLADGFDGVEKSYAIQAGREVRVVVYPERVNDAEAMQLARDIVKKVESELSYPGQIKVTVVRETRAVETAK
ncbi:MAG TPA: ribonuclease Y [Candidatus Hydrogenedentes bacterium]|nr:ribonuclease Y [Candidatus Hydrogenedentota bacterium]HPG70266.1 ribonuclease Y [Candidatus Hydrogenedentota bacterium]